MDTGSRCHYRSYNWKTTCCTVDRNCDTMPNPFLLRIFSLKLTNIEKPKPNPTLIVAGIRLNLWILRVRWEGVDSDKTFVLYTVKKFTRFLDLF